MNRKNVSKKILNNVPDKHKADVESQPSVESDFDSANLFVKNEVHFCYSNVSQELKSILPFQERDGKADDFFKTGIHSMQG